MIPMDELTKEQEDYLLEQDRDADIKQELEGKVLVTDANVLLHFNELEIILFAMFS